MGRHHPNCLPVVGWPDNSLRGKTVTIVINSFRRKATKGDNPALLAQAAADAGAYGWTIDNGQLVSPKGKESGVFVTASGNRLSCRRADGSLIFSGPAIPAFLERFWYAVKVSP